MHPLDALADPIRREIVQALAHAPQDAGQLGARFPVSRPATSRHLRVLREAGLVAVRPEGTHRVYTLEPQGLTAIESWLEGLRRPWERQVAQHLDALETEVARGRRERASTPQTSSSPGRRSASS